MATLQSVIDAAIFIAGVDNSDVKAEALIPLVFQNVALKAAADPQKQSLLYRTHTITLTNGSGSLPEVALSGCKFGATVSDPDDDTVGPQMSMVLHWQDFINSTDTRLGYWIIKGDRSIHWIEPNEQYESGSGKTGDIELTIASAPAIPATASTTVSADDEIVRDLINALAVAIKAQVTQAA